MTSEEVNYRQPFIWIESNKQGISMCLSTHNGSEDSRIRAIYHLLNEDDVDPETKQLKTADNLVCAEVAYENLSAEMREIVSQNLLIYEPETFVCFRCFATNEKGELTPLIQDNQENIPENFYGEW